MLANPVCTTARQSFALPEAVVKTKYGINVGVMPQVELISIIQTIGKYPTVFNMLMSPDSEYKTDVIDHFSSPSNIMIYTDSNLRIREDVEPDDSAISLSTP